MKLRSALFLLVPAVAFAQIKRLSENLDNLCDDEEPRVIDADAGDIDTFYTIYNSGRFFSPCRVRFQSAPYPRRLQVTVLGTSLDPFYCRVSVSRDSSREGDVIAEPGRFTRTVTSDLSGALTLRVHGEGCVGRYSLVFQVSSVCVRSDLTCQSGQCVLGGGDSKRCDGVDDCDDGSDEAGCVIVDAEVIIGVTVAVVAFLMLAAAVYLGVYRRRRTKQAKFGGGGGGGGEVEVVTGQPNGANVAVTTQMSNGQGMFVPSKW